MIFWVFCSYGSAMQPNSHVHASRGSDGVPNPSCLWPLLCPQASHTKLPPQQRKLQAGHHLPRLPSEALTAGAQRSNLRVQWRWTGLQAQRGGEHGPKAVRGRAGARNTVTANRPCCTPQSFQHPQNQVAAPAMATSAANTLPGLPSLCNLGSDIGAKLSRPEDGWLRDRDVKQIKNHLRT